MFPGLRPGLVEAAFQAEGRLVGSTSERVTEPEIQVLTLH
jgi:hypothetical protein